MWTNKNHGRADRSKLRYLGVLTDEDWAYTGLLIPPAKRSGNKRAVDEREVVKNLIYVLSTCCR